MNITVCKDYGELSRRAGNLIAAQVIAKPSSVLGLATGSSPIGTYQRLIALYRAGDLSFKHVKTVNLDEYVGLPGTHEQSYRYFMNDQLFNHVDIDRENTNVPDGTAADLAAEGKRYDDLIAALGGVDLQLLGVGNNGHIAFNEPCDHFPMGTHGVDLTPSTIEANARLFASADEVPRRAVTMGIGGIFSARKILLIAAGAAKAGIIKAAFFGAVTPQVPASVLQLHPDVTVLLDEEAAARL